MKNQKGFTLIEWLLLVTIICIIAAIAFPSLVRASARKEFGLTSSEDTDVAAPLVRHHVNALLKFANQECAWSASIAAARPKVDDLSVQDAQKALSDYATQTRIAHSQCIAACERVKNARWDAGNLGFSVPE